MILAIESFFFFSGVILFILCFFSLFLKGYFKFAVLLMLVADFFFLLAIVFPKTIARFMQSYNITLKEDLTITGAIVGLLIYILAIVIYKLLKKTPIKVTNKESQNTVKKEPEFKE